MSEPRKTVPGSNSWAQSSEQSRMVKTGPVGPKQPGRPTNRNKYEDKPMPPTPKASSSRSNQKDRAVTDPVISKPLVVTKKSLAELRENQDLIQSKEVYDEEMPLENQPPLQSAVSDYGSETMCAYPVADNNQGEISLSAPPTTTHTPHPLFSWTEDRSISPPVLPYRPRETNWPTPILTYASPTSNSCMGDSDNDETQGRHQGMIMGDGVLNPTRTGTYARVGAVGIVNQDDSQRVTSHVGVIETVESSEASNAPGYPSQLEGKLSHLEGSQQNPDTLQPQSSMSSMRSESNYGGVWEYHPRVGRSLPPFASGSPSFPPNPEGLSHQRSVSSRSPTVPIMVDDFRGGHNGTSSGLPSVLCDNFWMHSSQGNSYASSNMPSAINIPQPTAFHSRVNAVPPPPGSYPGFQPSVHASAGIRRMERNLHHHLDHCFGSLSRLMTEKFDKITDQVMKQLENSEEKVDKALKGVKGEMRDLKKDVSSRHRDIKEMAKTANSIREQVSGVDAAVKEVDSRIDALEKKTDEERVVERERVVHQPDEFPRRRTESAHATLGHHEQRRPRPSNSPNELRQGRQASRGRQNTMDDTGGSGARRHAGRSIRREHFTQVGLMRGEPPDLSQHPAYRQEQGHSPQDSEDARRLATGFQANGFASYQSSSQHGGWYRQAYGQ